ncbi:MAG TPA: methyltransferase domain-containing protein [Longimicrobiaceae bacterium]|nr:methyltransferase domain-containing protein [Longimicrobiaceae bacterium]
MKRRTGPAPRAEVRIDSIAAGGEGVGRLEDGRVVFVHRTAPGDLAAIELVKQQKRWARGRLLRVIEPSADRREAPCKFYARCGGCTLEHIRYDAQLRAKATIVRDALTRIAGLTLDIPEVVASPEEFRYRNRVSFTLRRLGRGKVVAGFHALHDPNTIVDLDGGCLLPEEPISRVWDRLRAAWGPDANLLPSGERLRLTLRANAAGEVTLLIEGGFTEGDAAELITKVDGLTAVWHRPAADPATLLAGAPGLPETWGDEEIELSGAAFLQVNRGTAALLEAHVVEQIGDPAGLTIVDAYCGIGVLARRLARAGATVTGIELEARAIAEARRNSPPTATFLEGPVESLLPDHLPADLVVLNPPRSGVAPEVVQQLIAEPPERLVYISCDPATLARDLGRLRGVLTLRHVRCFDLFPQTSHVETVAVLS